ncbi:MAG: diguanylate cyclase [Candidatus Omnitrophota bacterium]
MVKIYFRKLFLSSKKLKNELRIALGLITLILLVFLGYLFPGLDSSLFGVKSVLPFIAFVALFIVVISFLIIIQIVEPVIKISNEARLMAGGDWNRVIELAREDEIGELGMALNQMTRRIKDNVEQLRDFSKQTESINLEVNRRILILSSLIEISNLIAQSTDLEVILKAGADKCLEFGGMNFSCLILRDRATNEFKVHLISGDKSDQLIESGIKGLEIKLGKGLIGKTILKQDVTIIDSKTESSSEISEFKKTFLVDSAILAPITSKGNVFGLLIAGNNDSHFTGSSADKEVFYLISKQIAIAVTNDILKDEIRKLEVTDHLTGLFNNTFTRKRLNEEIKRAVSLQQPCSFALFSIDRFEEFRDVFGYIAAEHALITIGNVFKESISKDEKAARFGDHEFALILSAKNKRESIKIAEEIRKKIEAGFAKEEDPRKRLTCSGAIAENPIDGVTAEELILKSGVILAEAMNKGGNGIMH